MNEGKRELLNKVDEGKRDFMRKLAIGSAYAVPGMASFPLDSVRNKAWAQAVYGLGLLGYMLLAEESPYVWNTRQELYAAHVNQPPRKPTISSTGMANAQSASRARTAVSRSGKRTGRDGT